MWRAKRSPVSWLATLWVVANGCNPAGPAVTATADRPATVASDVLPPLKGAAVDARYQRVPAAVPPSADPRVTIPYLASDELAGRLPGTPGLVTAGDYLEHAFQQIGLAPPPRFPDGFQPFAMRLSTTLDPATGLLVNGKPMAVGTDYAPMSVSPSGRFRGPVVFAGYAISHTAHGTADYDDFATADVAGKVVLAMMKEPTDDHNHSRFAGKEETWSPAARFTAKAAAAKAHGAVGLLLVSPPSSGGPDMVRPFYAESDPTATAVLPVVQVSRRVADLLLTTANLPSLAAEQHRIDAAFAPAPAPLAGVDVSGDVQVRRSEAAVRNVLAALPGVGPNANEWVVVGAHYDHLGHGQLGHTMLASRGLFHGADDNASGTAAVLELAARLKAAADAGSPLPRSVLFCLFTGEEEGLIGSDHFVHDPAVPLNGVVAMLNLDMVGRLRNDTVLVGGQQTGAPFDRMVADATAGTGLHVSTFERGGLGPSDHMSFALQHVPVLFLFTGLHADYHRPTDTADKINYDGIDRIVTVAGRLVDAMAVMPRVAYDGTADGRSTMAFAVGHGSRAGRASLGVVPAYAAADGGGPAGAPISGVGPGTPAAAAGLRGGDLLVGFGPKPLANLQDLDDALAEAKPGDQVDLRLVRDGKPMTVRATLAERKVP